MLETISFIEGINISLKIFKIIILCQKWLTFINNEIKIEKAKVINIIRRIPKKEIIQLEGKLEPFVDEDTIHKRR